jgi:outer membrane receptor protein involved in Fe transport
MLLIAGAAALFSAPSASAQQGTTEIRGRVMDTQQAGLPAVSITLRNQDSGMFRETLSNEEGTYFVTSVTPGVYELTVRLNGFKTVTKRDLRLEIGRTATYDITLEVGGIEEVVHVAAEAPLVDASSKEVGGVISTRELTELPTINRNYIGFVGLLPGIIPNISTESFGSDSINVNGLDSRNNNYMLDGANNNDDVIGQRAGTQARTPLESIQEFQVLTNQYDAEFGRTTGAVINAVSKQGTNVFRGSAFTFAQDADMTAKDFFAKQNNLAKPDTKQQWYGGTIGGPIIKNKAHFFFSVERLHIDEGVTVVVPARPELNATTTEKTRVWNTLVRGDHQINANHTWGVRWLREYSPQLNQLIPLVGTNPVTLDASREEDDTDQTVVGSLNSVFGNSRVNTMRVSWTQENVAFANPAFNGNGRQQGLLDPTLNYQTYSDQQNSVAQARINNGYQIEDTFSWFVPSKRGDHDIKFGAQYQYSSNDAETQDNLNGTFSFGLSNGPFNASDPFTYPDRFSIRVPSSITNYTKAHFVSAFAQDKWKMNDRLTLSLGLRYDLEVVPVPELDNPQFASVDDYPVDYSNLSPRLGFAYNVGGQGKTVVRGGYGTFYDKTHFELIGGLYTAGVYSTSFTATFPANAVDPGPRNGRLPTDPFLVNGPVVNRALLEQMFPAGSRIKNTGTVNLDNPDRRIPYTHQITVGVERQLASNLSGSVDYVRTMARDQFMVEDLNPGLRDTTAVTSPLRRVDPNFTAAVNMPINDGSIDYDALLLQIEKRFSHSYSVRASYTLSYSRGNTSGAGAPASGFQVLDDLNLDLNEGPTNVDRRHNFVVSGTALVPKTGGLNVSWVARALSGLPFTILNNQIDPDRNGTQAEPLPAGSYSGTGVNAITVENKEERNGAYGPGFFQLDMRIGYQIRLPHNLRFDVFGEIFNVTNRANFANPSGNQGAPATFLILQALRDGGVPRTGQIGLRFTF